MMKLDTHSHPFSSVLIRSGATVTPFCPALSYREADDTGVDVRLQASRSNSPKPGEWPPKEYALPSTVAEIERGRIVQWELFDEQPGRFAGSATAAATGGRAPSGDSLPHPPVWGPPPR